MKPFDHLHFDKDHAFRALVRLASGPFSYVAVNSWEQHPKAQHFTLLPISAFDQRMKRTITWVNKCACLVTIQDKPEYFSFTYPSFLGEVKK